jgi:hypothetical protein
MKLTLDLDEKTARALQEWSGRNGNMPLDRAAAAMVDLGLAAARYRVGGESAYEMEDD